MELNITGRDIELTDALRSHVTDKFKKIQHLFNNITNVHVILSIDQKYQQKAEATVNLARGQLFAESQAVDMYAAIDLMMKKLEQQTIKHKEKLNKHAESRIGKGRKREI